MELILAQQSDYQVHVTCDGQFSHTFDLQPLRLLGHWLERITNDPIRYGQLLFQALFPPEAKAWQALNAHPERIVLINMDDELDTLPWEYLYGLDGFLVLGIPFVRGLPNEQRIPAPTLDMSLHIVAIPSNPLSNLVEPLNIDAEWQHLTEVITPLPFDITLERVRPPTLEQVRHLIANTQQRVIHFMGHGGQFDNGAFLCFERENGELDLIEAQQLLPEIEGSPFLISLNACVSASPGPTEFSNLAASIVKAKVPYALGMRFRIYDDDALVFSRMLYTELAQGAPIETALLHVRRSLAQRPRTWTVGVPVLYTSLATPAGGFVQRTGASHIDEHQPPIDASSIVRARGTFQGRIEDLKRLGDLLTGEHRPPILTIHGGGGQGKTALAREAMERFAYAWPGGIWGTMLDPLPERSQFVNQLAQFLGVPIQEVTNPKDLEGQVLCSLGSRRTLLVLDNAETLVHAMESNDSAAIALAEFLHQLPATTTSLLVTSRVQLGWSGEITHELGGLTAKEGAFLFQQYAPERLANISIQEAQTLSQKVEGHPLGLRLLAGAFNASDLSLQHFIQSYEQQLSQAENAYVGKEHRHRKLYASIETSIRYLNNDLRAILGNLWIFQAPFLPGIARSIFDPDTEETDNRSSPVDTQLKVLWQRGLLAHMAVTAHDGSAELYYLLPTTRPYIEKHLTGTIPREQLQQRYGEAYRTFINEAYAILEYNTLLITVARYMEKDLERSIHYIADPEYRRDRAHCAWILFRLGKLREARMIFEDILEQAQGQDQLLELEVSNLLGQLYQAAGQHQHALTLFQHILPSIGKVGNQADEAGVLYNMAKVYQAIGQPQRALELYERALPILHETGRLADEAATISNIAMVYQTTGQPQRALELYEQALPILRDVGRRADEAAAISNIAMIYQTTGQPQRALELYEYALSIQREIGNRGGEAIALSNIAAIHQNDGHLQRALLLFEQALSIQRAIGDRGGEATTLSNIGLAYKDQGQPQHALTLMEQALSIRREVGDRTGEAATLNNIASVYMDLRHLQRALELFEQALPIRREVGNRAGEAATLHNMAGIYENMDQTQQALSLYEQALSIRHEVGDRTGEAITLHNIAGIHYRDNNQPQHALSLYEQALALLQEVHDHDGEARTLISMAHIYQTMNQPQRALSLYEQALFSTRKTTDHVREATVLLNMAEIYQAIGQNQRALELLEQIPSITHKTDSRTDEATILNRMGRTYHQCHQPQHALALFEQALAISREVNDRLGEATALSNIGLAYRALNQPKKAISFYEQALPILRECNYRVQEANVLSNMAMAYYVIGQLQRAIELFEQAIPVLKDVDDHVGQITALNNLGLIYQDSGQPQRALSLYEQALSIAQQIGRRANEASILNSMVIAYQALGQPQYIMALLEQALSIFRELGDHMSEAATLNSMAVILYADLKRPAEALHRLQQARHIFEQYGLVQDTARNTLEKMNSFQWVIHQGLPPGPLNIQRSTLMPSERQRQMMVNTIAVMTKSPERHQAWRQRVMTFLEESQAKRQGNNIEADFYRSLLDILDGKALSLSPDHPYISALTTVQNSITKKQDMAAKNTQDEASFLETNSKEIITIINNTLAVLSQAKNQKQEWRTHLAAMRQALAQQQEISDFIIFLDTLITLLDTNGDPTGLGKTLTSTYIPIWRELLYQLETIRQQDN
ncbi:hypothetical protein KDH_15030 [Dictyobacter sp. S3.2.2.5]|uniref:CHAT domain-containing protein n=1 Tax=Dictyobacter halimunensis TaxID=3026934 RepID=A0ABQ6FKB7_9CHLR|nr:hypothetical protein KDH_15030 [Dictyobacter sp. S3.2.2.5]